MTPLEERLAQFLGEQDLLRLHISPYDAAKTIIQWLTEEYDRQVDEALGEIKKETASP